MTAPHPKTTSVAAIVVTHNRLPDLERCLGALRRQSRELGHIIVVDNASTDVTAVYLQQQPDVTVVSLAENLGGAGGFDRGMEAAIEVGAKWWWLMDDDCLPSAGSLEQLVDASEQDDSGRLAGAAPMVEYEDGLKRCGMQWIIGRRMPDVGGGVDWAPFLGLLLSSHACVSAGPVRADFFIHWDDIEYCLRLRSAGLRLLAVPEAAVAHPAISTEPQAAWKDYYGTRNSVVVRCSLEKTSLARFKTLTVCVMQIMRDTLMLARRPRENRARIGLRLLGLWDALFGRMGRRVLPSAAGVKP